MRPETKQGLKEFGNVMGIIAIMGLASIGGIGICMDRFARTERNPQLRVYVSYNNERVKSLNYSYGVERSYIDTVPLGSLDYIIDNSSGERIERKPTQEEYSIFRKMGAEAK